MSYKTFFNSNPLPIWVISRKDFRFLQTNQAATELFGFTPDEFKTMKLGDLHTPAEMQCFRQALTRKDYRAAELCGWQGRTKRGETLDLELRIHPVETRQGPALIVIPLDVRERLDIERQMQQAQKMEAVGMLAGGIAHDFNNLLTIISGYSQMLLASRTPDERDRPALEQILKASERAAELTGQLLNFSRRQNIQPKVQSLNSVVLGMSKMLRRLIGDHVDLRIQLRDDAGMVRVDTGKAGQVVLNLVVNSRDAIHGSGGLTIATRREDLDPERAQVLRLRPGRYAVLEVTDTGSGMDQKTRDRAFEPFFTTKEQGTGLGLSTVSSIVKQANGGIQLRSETGVGTSIEVYFPRVDEEAPVEAPAEAEPAAAGKETILVVEDEEAVRRLMCTALEQNGHRVLIAADGMEALNLISQHSGPPDLLVTDLLMPGMNGAELARQVRARLPGIEVLYISGYGEEMRKSGEIDENSFLQKPFAPQALLRKVRDMLDRHGRRSENQRSGA